MNSQQAFELLAATAEQCHKAARAAQAIAECVCLPDIDTCELDAIQAAVTAELQDRDGYKKFKQFIHTINRMNHEHKSTGTINRN